MARFTGATVLLILVTTVSVYTFAILAGAALGRTLERSTTTKQPPADSTLRVRGIADYFAKELWGGDHREGSDRYHAGGDEAVLSSAASVSRSPRAITAAADQESTPQAMLRAAIRREISGRDDVHGGAAARPWSRHSNFSGEITDGTLPRGGVIKVGPWGGSGGQAFYMRGGGASAPRLRSVTLYHSDDAIHAFSYQYSDEAGVKRTQRPLGGDAFGSTVVRATIIFSSDEHLTAVEGTFGNCRSVPQVVVTSLTFRTDKGRMYGPYGEETGTPFSIPAANGCIVGFWGRSGWLLDAIGVYITPCQVYMAAS